MTGPPASGKAGVAPDVKPATGGLSLGAKFIGLTAGLILLLSVTALISLRNSAQTVGQVHSVVDYAIPAYAALARSHIRSLEQALELRRAQLAATPAEAAAHEQAFIAAHARFHQEIGDAERLLKERRDSTASAVETAELERLVAELHGLISLAERYNEKTAACLAAIRAGRPADARQQLFAIDGLRDELDQHLEALRAGLFASLQTMARDAQAAQAKARLATVVVFVLSSILGLGAAAIAAMRLIRAIRSVVRGAEAVEQGDLTARIDITSHDEIGRLAASFNHMTEGLRMRDLIRDMFGRYVDRRVAEQLIGPQSQLSERGDRREVAVLFCDLAGFTALSEDVPAEQLVQLLNRYFSIIAAPIAATDGIIDKYIGDGLMAYWCPPFVAAEQVVLRAAEATVCCLKEVPAISAAARAIFGAHAADYVAKIRIGIASGQSLTGSIGAEQRRNYTVIGDPVNLAARLEAANRHYGTASLVSGPTAERIGRQFELRQVDCALLPGIDAPQTLYEILDRAGALSAGQRDLKDRYEAALVDYRRGDLAAAGRAFAACLALAPEDGPTRVMLKRIERLAATPAAGEGWTGVWHLSKDDLA